MNPLPNKTEKHSEIILKSDSQTQKKTYVHSKVTQYLKDHQIDGIKFLFENCYQSNSGCILAHCMGLGKTLTSISLLHAVINSKEHETNKMLVLCPISTIMNWKEEIVRWLGQIQDGHRKLQFLELDQKDTIDRKLSALQNWSQCDSDSPAVCLIMGYESFRNLVNFHTSKANAKKFKESRLRQIRERIQRYLLDPADIVICDEGHVIKNNTAAVTLAVNQIRTKRRVILTGTPVQNHLMEYYSMVNFVKPDFLGTKQYFNEYFAEPIKSGQHADSCETDIKYMKQRSFALNKKLSKIVQRREISLLKDFLPEKFEFVLFIPLTQIQYDLYKYFLDNRGGVIEYKRLFGDYTCLRKIWTHLKVLDNAHQKSMAKKKRSTNNDDGSDADDADEEYALSGELQMVDNDWWRKVIDKKQLEDASSSHKMIILFEILNECKRVGDKCVIFSSFVEVLNVVEFFMQQIDQRNGNAGLENFVGPWRKNEDYYRLDGSTPKDRRHSMIKNFNDVSNKRTKVFLISAQAGGQGVNLFGANRLILLDTSWNPARDQQSIYRIYRMGQTKQCYIYRLLSMGTMEEKIYSRSVTKQAMSCRVVDKHQIDRHYSMNELYELYSLTKTDLGKRATPIPPKDDLLAQLLRKYPNMIFKYLEHDSLLANKVEEELNEIEKNEAWQRCQEQNMQMQALNNMMSSGQQSVAPFKLHNEPAVVLKERSVDNMGKKAAFSQYNKENVPTGGEMAGSISGTTINIEHEIWKHKSSFLSDDKPMDAQTSLLRCESLKWLPASDGVLIHPLDKVETGCNDDIEVGPEESLLKIEEDIDEPTESSNQPSSSEMKRELSEDKSSSLSDDQQMDAQTSLLRCESFKWLPASDALPIEPPNDDIQGPLLPPENCENGSDNNIDEGAKRTLTAVANDESNDLLDGNKSEHIVSDISQKDAQASHKWAKACVSPTDSNATLTESSNVDNQEILLTLENVDDVTNSSLNYDTTAVLLPLQNMSNDKSEMGESTVQANDFLNKLSTSNGTQTDCWEDKNSVFTDSQRMNAQTCSKPCQWPADSNATSSNGDAQGAVMPLENVTNGCNDSSHRDIQVLPLENIENGNHDNMEGNVERSLAYFVKGLLLTLNNKYAVSSQQPYPMEDYTTEEQIIRPNRCDSLEYRIALKRPSDGTLQPPIKRLKLSLEIDHTAAITVDHLMSTLPLATDCQLNATMEHPQSPNTDELISESSSEDEELCPKGSQQSKKVADLPTTESTDGHFNVAVESDEIVAKTNGSDGKEANSAESTSPADKRNDASLRIENEHPSPPVPMNVDDERTNELTERLFIDLPNSDEISEDDEYMSVTTTYSHGRINCSHSDSEEDPYAGMSESETAEAEYNGATLHDERSSILSKIKERCVLM